MDPTLPVDDEAEPREPKGLTKLFAKLGAFARERMGPAAPALPTITFVLGWLYLNAFAGSTWPLGESGFPGYLLPSPEATLGLGLICALVWLGVKPHATIYSIQQRRGGHGGPPTAGSQ